MTAVFDPVAKASDGEAPERTGCAFAGSSACVRGAKQPELLQVSVITDDPAAAAAFYAALFYAADELTVNPQSYRGVAIKGGLIGFSAPDVRGRLNLDEGGSLPEGRASDTGFFTIKLACADAVAAFAERAQQLGATLLVAPGETPFGWFCAVLRDPAGHVFRLAALPTQA